MWIPGPSGRDDQRKRPSARTLGLGSPQQVSEPMERSTLPNQEAIDNQLVEPTHQSKEIAPGIEAVIYRACACFLIESRIVFVFESMTISGSQGEFA